MWPQMLKEEVADHDGESEQTCESSQCEESVKKVRKRKLGADKEMMHAFLSSVEFNPSRLRSRKEMPALKTLASKKEVSNKPTRDMSDFKMVDLSCEDGPSVIGRRVEVYWPDSRRWFRGRIKAFDHQKLVHKIDYDDGDKEYLDMTKEVFRMQVFPGESLKIKADCNIRTTLQLPIAKVASELQNGHGAENGNDSDCLGLSEKDLEKALNHRHSISLTGVAEVNNSCSALTDVSLVESSKQDNMEEVSAEYQTKSSGSMYSALEPKEKAPNMKVESFEDEYLDILKRKQRTLNSLGSIWKYQMGDKNVLPNSH